MAAINVSPHRCTRDGPTNNRITVQQTAPATIQAETSQTRFRFKLFIFPGPINRSGSQITIAPARLREPSLPVLADYELKERSLFPHYFFRSTACLMHAQPETGICSRKPPVIHAPKRMCTSRFFMSSPISGVPRGPARKPPGNDHQGFVPRTIPGTLLRAQRANASATRLLPAIDRWPTSRNSSHPAGLAGGKVRHRRALAADQTP